VGQEYVPIIEQFFHLFILELKPGNYNILRKISKGIIYLVHKYTENCTLLMTPSVYNMVSELLFNLHGTRYSL